MTKSICPSCTEPVVRPYGYNNAPILIISSSLSRIDMEKGRPFCGPIGKILRMELARVHLDMYRHCRLVAFRFHPPDVSAPLEKAERCFKAGVDVCLEEAKGKKAILITGADAVEYFTEYSVSKVSGLQVDVTMFSAPIIFAMVSPDSVLQNKGVGEVRFALDKFSEALEKEGDI